jgi:hypothetical protein
MTLAQVSKLADSIATEFVYPSKTHGGLHTYTGVVTERDDKSILVQLHDDYGIREAGGLKPEYRRFKLDKLVSVFVLN